jgi:hypothetical protein
VSGRVVRFDGSPFEGVTVTLAGITRVTGKDGYALKSKVRLILFFLSFFFFYFSLLAILFFLLPRFFYLICLLCRKYQFSEISSGTYTITAARDDYAFAPLANRRISSSENSLPDITVSKVRVSGQILQKEGQQAALFSRTIAIRSNEDVCVVDSAFYFETVRFFIHYYRRCFVLFFFFFVFFF